MKDTIADLTVAAALRDEKVLAQLGEMTGLTRRKLESRLAASSSRTRLRTALAEELPLTFEKLSVLSLKQVRTWGLAPEIVRVWNLSEEVVERIVATVHGRTLVWRAFDPTSAKERAAADEITSLPDHIVESGMRAAWDAVSRAIKFVTSGSTPEEGDESEAVPETEEAHHAAGKAPTIVALKLDAAGSWSRPRQISQVLRVLGLNVPQRLHTSTFQAMLLTLDELSVEARLENDDEPLTKGAPSPGIAARVRLRLSGASVSSQKATLVTPPQRAPVVASTALSASRADVRVVEGATPRSPPVLSGHRRPSGYELALLRLRFLTGVPSACRQREPEWPTGFLAAASEGLSLEPSEVKLLQTVSTGLVWGNHNAVSSSGDLVKFAEQHDLRGLVEHMIRLNPDTLEAEKVAREVHDLHTQLFGRPCGPWPVKSPTPAAAPIAINLVGSATDTPPRREPPRPNPTPATPNRISPAIRASAPEPVANARDLGALDSMFDDPMPETAANVRSLGALDNMFDE